MTSTSQAQDERAVHDAMHAWQTGTVDLATLCDLADEELTSACQRGMQLLTAGLNEQALRVLEGVCALRPKEASFVRALGFAYSRSEQPAKAYRTFGRARALDPSDAISRLMEAECAALSLGPQAAAPLLQEALRESRPSAQVQPYIMRAQRLLTLCMGTKNAAASQARGQGTHSRASEGSRPSRGSR